MPLTLEVVGQKAVQMGAAARKVFNGGGTIGRLRDNDWVLPDEYISGHHAKILYSGGAFLIEDTSTNGVFINSPQNRLPRGQPHALRDGDTVFIDDYEVRVTVGAEAGDAAGYAPFASAAAPMIPPDSLLVGAEAAAGGAPEDMDPLRLLGLEDAPAIAPGPSAASLAYNSPLSQHYRPPAASAPPPAAPAAPARAVPGQAGGHFIPIDYDPFAPEETAAPKGPPRTVAIPTPPPQAALSTNAPVSAPPPRRSANAPARPANDAMRFVPRQGVPAGAAVPAAGVAVPRSAPATTVEGPPAAASTPLAASTPAGAPTPAVMPGAPQGARRTRGEAPGDLDFAALLAAAGIEAVATPELSQKFGQILRVVVAGLMDVLRARGKIKDEFRMRMTTFKQEDNNPLKFSANVEDALHNLLVKRNAAYLGPVEAFEDAFQELRNHQMAMLAGMRVAYDAMLAEFDPARLQDEFDKHVKAGSFLSGPAKLRYWELYRNRFHDMVKDADSSFRHLFGDEFAKAYEEQLVRLKTLSRADRR